MGFPPQVNAAKAGAGGAEWRRRIASSARVAAWLLAFLAYAFAFQGSRGLWEPDEGRYTDVALEMLRLGDIIQPFLHHELPHYTKPPLTYWAIAASVRAFGRSEWAVRLPNALAFVGTVLAIWALGCRLVPRRPWLPALVYAGSLLPYTAANIVTTDTLLTFFETVAVLGFVLAWRSRDAGRRRLALLLMWSGFGLAFLTKGPPGLLPLLALLCFAAWTGGFPGVRRLFTVAGLILFALLGLSWYLLVSIERPELLHYFLREEVVGRVATARHNRNPQWYGALLVYVPTLLVGSLPWTGEVLAALKATPRLLHRRFWAERRRHDPEGLLLLCWLLLPLAVFFVARSRLQLYILPLWAPLALLLARGLADRMRLSPSRRAALGLWLLFLVGIRFAASALSYERNARDLADAMRRSAGSPVDEVVFVGSRPYYGLSLYLDAEVERIELEGWQAKEGEGVTGETLRNEEEELEGRRVFVVADPLEPAFLEQVSATGMRAIRAGTHHRYRFFTLTTDSGG